MKDKQNELAEMIWESVRAMDYDPLMANFKNLEDPIKANLMRFASKLLDGESGIYKQLET